MRAVPTMADEVRRLDGYLQARQVSLLAIAVVEVDDYGRLSEREAPQAVAQTLADFAEAASFVIERQCDGLVVRWGGGQLVAVFAAPTSAVRAVAAMQSSALPLRTGCHLGQVAMQRVGVHVDVFGKHVHRATCMARAAHVGEILVTESIADNVRDAGGLLFAPRGRVHVDGIDDPLELYALANEAADAGVRPLPVEYIEVETSGRRVLFDAAVDRRVVIGRGKTCDIPLHTPSSSRRHSVILFDRPRWLLWDMGSTNGTALNGVRIEDKEPLMVGDEIQIGDAAITVTRLCPLPRTTVTLRVDLQAGAAHFEGKPIQLSAAELVWFAHLAWARKHGDGWVVVGQEGHETFGAFARRLWRRPWTTAVRTRPLLDLVDGNPIDDEDLRNLRGKTVQKLKRVAARLVPESDGRSRRRLLLPADAIEIVEP
jgi:class 3 adenylate cyclase